MYPRDKAYELLLSTTKLEEKTIQETLFAMFNSELFSNPFNGNAQVRESRVSESLREGELTGFRYSSEKSEGRLHDTLFRKNPSSFNFSNQQLKNLFGRGFDISDNEPSFSFWDRSPTERRDENSINRFRELFPKSKEQPRTRAEQEEFFRDLLSTLKIKNEKTEDTRDDLIKVKDVQLKDWIDSEFKKLFQAKFQNSEDIRQEKIQKIEVLKEAVVKKNEIKVAVHQKREAKRDVLQSVAKKQVFDQGHLMDQRNQLLRQVYSYNDLLSRPALLGLDKNDITMFEEKLRNHWFQLTAIDQTIQQLNSAVQYAQGEVFFLGSLGNVTQA